MNFWQVAAGQGARDYSEVFLRFGVMLAGPGYPGPAPDRKDWYEEHENHVLAFAEQAQPLRFSPLYLRTDSL